jgi:hypothetical protein
VGALIGLAIVFVPARLLPADNLVVLALPLAFFFAVLLHELGHVAAGLVAGLEFRRVLVGPLAFTREARGCRLRFLGKRFLAGGYTQMIPRGPADIRRKFLLFLAGGPVATLLLFLPVAVLPWGTITAALLFANLVLAPFSLIPMEMQGFYTDARGIQILRERGPAANRLAAVLYLLALDGQGVAPREWPGDVVAKALEEGGGTAFRTSGRIVAHMYAQDAVALENALAVSQEMTAGQRLTYFAEAAFFQGATNRNGARARAWLNDARAVKGAIAQKGWDERALSAIAVAEGDEAGLREHVARALEYLDRQPGPSGSVNSLRARLAGLSATAPAPSTHLPAL